MYTSWLHTGYVIMCEKDDQCSAVWTSPAVSENIFMQSPGTWINMEEFHIISKKNFF